MSLNKKFQASLVTNIKSINESDDGDLIIEGYANTITRDRAGDVIPADTWSKGTALENYFKNPILLAFHNHSMPIGKVLEIEVREFGLYVRAKVSQAAGNIYGLIKDGILSTFSVGFMIKDAEYDHKTDTYFITDVELTEISVVSVPCNQDSTFSVAKSIESSTEYENFKKNFIQEEEKTMSFDLDKFKQEILGDTTKAVADALAAQRAAEAEEARKAAEAEAARKAAKDEFKSVARTEAEALVAELQKSLADKDTAFAEAVKKHEDNIVKLQDEIAQIVASQRNTPVAAGVNKALAGQVDEKDVDAIVMLGMIKKVPMDQTEFGKKHFATMKAVNTSSSIQVSSEAYETIFSTNLIRDIQKRLIIAPLFSEITMTAANLTVPINPDRKNASWVDSADYGTNASSGDEITVALTEKTLRTFKLAAKSYLTEETQEDVIIAMVPLLRQHLVEAHANEIDRAFLLGTGNGMPKGLVTQAGAIAAGAAVQVTTAKADASVRLTAKELLKGRRKLGLYGINRSELALVVSTDAYWDLLEDDEWGDVQQVGGASVKLVGEVGNIYGMPVLVSDQFPEPAAEGPLAVMVNKTNFVVTRQRGATVKTDFDVEKDRRVFVATQRLNLEPWIEATPNSGNGKGVVVFRYAAA